MAASERNAHTSRRSMPTCTSHSGSPEIQARPAIGSMSVFGIDTGHVRGLVPTIVGLKPAATCSSVRHARLAGLPKPTRLRGRLRNANWRGCRHGENLAVGRREELAV